MIEFKPMPEDYAARLAREHAARLLRAWAEIVHERGGLKACTEAMAGVSPKTLQYASDCERLAAPEVLKRRLTPKRQSMILCLAAAIAELGECE